MITVRTNDAMSTNIESSLQNATTYYFVAANQINASTEI